MVFRNTVLPQRFALQFASSGEAILLLDERRIKFWEFDLRERERLQRPSSFC
jgi:hypothetical protein